MSVESSGSAPEAAPRGVFFAWLSLAVVVVVLDQLSKYLIVENLRLGETVNVLPFFSWVYWTNEGAAFSFLNDAGGWQRWAFVALACGFSTFLIRELRRLATHEWVQALAFALIVGGALGNMIDRALLGHVVDFLRFYWADWYFPAFNLADSAIFLGAVLWFTLIWREGRQPDAS